MQATQTLETIIETGWHHLTVPPYAAGEQPRLLCWCGQSIMMPFTNGRSNDMPEIGRFLSEHAECPPNEEWLMQQEQGGAQCLPVTS
jgi:hypothetical protein